MSMSLSIHPVSDNLEMYGAPDASSAYSLSGVVSIAVSSPYSIFDGRKVARLLLRSLSLTFEGQSEIYTPNTGYSALRLCAITRELVPGEPMELSNEGHEDDGTPCKWNVVFNIPVPGWLPASMNLGLEDIGVRYGLYATAQFINLESEQETAWSFATLCTPFRSRVRSASTSRSICLQRFVLPPHIERPEPTPVNYLVNCSKTDIKSRIPSEILGKIQVLASVPEAVNAEEGVLPITIRLRTKDLDAAQCKRLQATEISIDIIQQERCRYRPSANFLAQHPLPPLSMQPPHVPLRDPHPMSNVYDVGLYISKEHSESVCRTFTLLPPGETGRYKLGDNNYVFAQDVELGDNSWYTMETRVPFAQVSRAKSNYETEEWTGPAVLRPSFSSPLVGVAHEVSLSLTFTYDVPESTEVTKERLNFKVPVTFGKYLPPSRSRPVSPSTGASGDDLPLSLPSYSQLYDRNGERKIDYSVPLPRYTPKEEMSTDPGMELSPTSIGDKVQSELEISENEPLLAGHL